MSALFEMRFALLQQRAEVSGAGTWRLPNVRCSRHGVWGSWASCPSAALTGVEDEARYRTLGRDSSTLETVSGREFREIAARMRGILPETCIQPAVDLGPYVGNVNGPTSDVLIAAPGRFFFREDAVERFEPFNLQGLRFAPCSLSGTKERFLELDPIETSALDRGGRRVKDVCEECGRVSYEIDRDSPVEWVQLGPLPDVDVMRPDGFRMIFVSARLAAAAEELWLTNWAVDPITLVTK